MWEGKGWILALLVTALGLALRLGSLGEFWLNGDEGLYDYIAHAPIELARIPISSNAHPPHYFWLLRGVAFVADDFVWLRVPALLFGCAAIFAMYQLGRELGGEVSGLAAALMAALSPGAITLSQVIRPYAFQNLLIVLALLFFFRYLRRRSAGDLLLYTGCMLLALFIQYGSFLLPGGVALLSAVFALTRRLDARAVRELCLAYAPLVIAGALLFWLQIRPNLIGQPIQKGAVEGWLAGQFGVGPGGVWRNLLGLFDYLAGLRFAAAGVVAFFAGLAVCVSDRRGEIAGLCAAVLVVAITVSSLALYPFGGTRHSFHLAPLIALPIAYAVGWVVDRGARVAAVAAAVAAGLVFAAGPVEVALGFPAERKAPEPEFVIPRQEVEALRPAFAAIADSPGLAIMDLETVYTLSPLWREAGAWPSWFGSPPIAAYRVGERLVVAPPVWHLDGGLGQDLAHRPLRGVLRSIEENLPNMAEHLGRDVRVISTGGERILESIRRLQRGGERRGSLTDEVVGGPHVVIFRLNVDLYRKALVRRAAAPRRRTLPTAEPVE
jgi:hypothetical protein